MSQFIDLEKQNIGSEEYYHLVPLSKAKVALGNKVKKQLISLERNMEGMLVSDIFKELTQRQQRIIDSNMETSADNAFQGMKKKLQVYGKGRRSTVFVKQKMMKSNIPKSIVSIKQKIQLDNNIYLERKYVNNISTRLQAIKEATKIENQKRKIRHWKNKEHNSCTKSPNFCRMAYLLQSLSRKDLDLVKFRQNTTGETIQLPDLLQPKKFKL